jgi:hypothetical protein
MDSNGPVVRSPKTAVRLSPDHFSIFGWNPILEQLNGCRGAKTGSVDVVLQGDGNAMERPSPLSLLLLCFHHTGGRQRLIFCHSDERIQRAIVSLNPPEACLSQFDGSPKVESVPSECARPFHGGRQSPSALLGLE